MNMEKMIATAIVKNGYITQEELMELGLSSSSIKKRVKKKKLKKLDADKFILGFTKNYERLGLECLSENKTEEALDYLMACYISDPQNPAYNLYAIFVDAYNFRFDRMNSYLDVLMEITDEWRPFYNYCLLLLNRTTLLNVTYRTAAKSLTVHDLPQETFEKRRRLQDLILNQLFVEASIELAKDIENKQPTFKTRLLKLLLDRVNSSNRYFSIMLEQAIRDEKFEYAFKLLWSENNKYPLKFTQRLLYLILEDIVTMRRTGRYDSIYACETDSIENLIKCRNYRRLRNLIISSKTVLDPQKQNCKMVIALIDYAIKYREFLMYKETCLEMEEKSQESSDKENEAYRLKPIGDNNQSSQK